MLKRSLTLRLAVFFGTLFAAATLGLGVYIADSVEHHFEEGDLAELHGKLELTRAMLAQVHSPEGFAHIAQQLDAALVGHHGLSIAVVRDGGRGETLFATSGADFPRTLVADPACVKPASQPDYPPGRVWEQGVRTYRAVVAQARTGSPVGAPACVVVSMDIGHHREFMRGFERSLWFAVGIVIVLTGLLGMLAARGGLAPLRQMAEVARGISASRLHKRIDLAGLPDEVGALAAEFNAMMGRLEEGFRRLSESSAEIAHELRTPISNLMTQTQVALARARSAEEYREILVSNFEEYERLARMISDMLFLAQADNGLLPRPAEAIELADEARALVEFYEALAEERGVHLTVAGAAAVTGDRLMLRRAVSNLLSNALRHSPSGGRVAIEIGSEHGMAFLAVSNSGDPIPAEHLSRIFDRFHRVAPDRGQHGDGAGLGLAITRSIVEAHGGQVTVSSTPQQTRFTLRLPPVPEPLAGPRH